MSSKTSSVSTSPAVRGQEASRQCGANDPERRLAAVGLLVPICESWDSEPMKGLLIRSPWVDLILEGRKSWEIRGTSTSIRGEIALIASGTGTVVGTCELLEAVGPLTLAEYKRNAARIGVASSELGRRKPYDKTYAWVLTNASQLAKPVAYSHPSGAVIWVNLPEDVARRIKRARRRP